MLCDLVENCLGTKAFDGEDVEAVFILAVLSDQSAARSC